MKARRLKFLVCLALITVMAATFASVALAEPHITWKTLDVYFDENGKPVVRGYFYNDGTVTIDRVNWVKHDIWIRHDGGNMFYLGAATWTNINVYLRPGETSEIFRMRWQSYTGPDYNITSWRTNSTTNYHYITGTEL